MNWYIEVLKKYAVFTGRAHRTEYWMFLLINIIIAFAIGFIEGFMGSPGVVGMIYSLAVLLPGIAVGVRRLHDTDRSGWWLLIGLIPIIGAIVLIVFFVQDSTPGQNRFGSNPKGERSSVYYAESSNQINKNEGGAMLTPCNACAYQDQNRPDGSRGDYCYQYNVNLGNYGDAKRPPGYDCSGFVLLERMRQYYPELSDYSGPTSSKGLR
ncbi:DUF805 domain-containing protein [Candidatus Thiosymbion oneisti]|uniref:DUF805 domain-containing protein n=1 Tax=Candidatus Thiosymbion oneisti TaxID=589554 RepID=UPI000AA903F2|nr:DUF805 domain-containing protein [Candidatus Thiosymbion oneisti]